MIRYLLSLFKRRPPIHFDPNEVALDMAARCEKWKAEGRIPPAPAERLVAGVTFALGEQYAANVQTDAPKPYWPYPGWEEHAPDVVARLEKCRAAGRDPAEVANEMFAVTGSVDVLPTDEQFDAILAKGKS